MAAAPIIKQPPRFALRCEHLRSGRAALGHPVIIRPMTPDTSDLPWVEWHEDGETRRARWRSESRPAPPALLLPADDTLTANTAFRLVNEGTGLVWRGDFQNARQLLQALARRVDRPPRTHTPKAGAAPPPAPDARTVFLHHRERQARRAALLGQLLLPVAGDRTIPLRRAPDVRPALAEAWGPADGDAALVSLRELQGLIGAHEWRKKGVEVPSLGARIHPHYGVFSPVRGEYVDLVARAPFARGAPPALAFEIGTGTGVLAALLARRGVARVIATEVDARAQACARDNLARLGLLDRVEVAAVDMFPPGRAPLVLCNPPWVPAQPASAIERAVYDPDSTMLRRFLAGLASHLEAGGEGWLILSDLAQHLGLRTRDELTGWIADGGLRVLERLDTRPVHRKAHDPDDPLAAARTREVTSLWRLAAA
jgi:methylase of polypeptide subunit release factors